MDTNYAQECYDKNDVLSNCKDIMLEAKRVILNEQLEKIANMTLSHIKINNEHQDGLENNKSVVKDMETDRFKLMYEKMQHQTTKKDTIDDDEMENSNDFKTTHKNLIVLEQTDNYNHSKAIEIKIFNSEQQINSNKDKFLDNYCEIQNTNDEEEMSPNKPNQQEKLEAFIEKIKDMKNKEASKKSIEFERNSGKSRSSFKNRFMAQKNIIDIQKAKLDEQNKMIEELKLGIMREDILKSIEHTKFNIREIFANCSEKIKCKVPIACDQENKFNVSIQKAPKIVQRMEDRAVERARNREVILERKRLVEEMRRKMLEEAIENKRVLEEEERKRTLEIMKEKRKKELQLEKIRHEKRKIYEEKLHKAIDFHEFLLKQQCLRKLYNNVIFSREKYLIAVEHYRKKVLGESMNMWINFVDGLYVVKYEMADAHFSYKIFRYCIEMWKQRRLETIRNMQVAQDVYDLRLTSNVFICWHRYVCKQLMIERSKLIVAEKHYNRHLLFHCFYQWTSLKAVLELEKAKALKKQKWREKVWEILPDYKPPEDL